MDGAGDTEPALMSWLRTVHAVVAALSPWVLIAVQGVALRRTSTLADEIGLLRTLGYATTAVCVLLLISALILRRSRPSAAVSYPFAVLWLILGVVAAVVAGRISLDGLCGSELQLCMPGLTILFFGVPLALCVTAAVLGSAAVDWGRHR